jgi:hypothetical protein
MITRSPNPGAGAIFSDCGIYRYLLWRDGIGSSMSMGCVLFVLLNPSTADENVLDPTLTRCKGFARRFGYPRLEVVNLFALRSTDPNGLYGVADPIGPNNDQIIAERMADADVIVVGWGAFPLAVPRCREVAGLTRGKPLYCLGTTQDGHPRHPLYLRADSTLIPWTEP